MATNQGSDKNSNSKRGPKWQQLTGGDKTVETATPIRR